MRINNRLTAIFMLALLFLLITAAGTKKEAEIIFEAEREKEPIPLLTLGNPELTLEQAYEIQTEYVRCARYDKTAIIRRDYIERGTGEVRCEHACPEVLFSSECTGSSAIDGSNRGAR
jgi:hypothetical protein